MANPRVPYRLTSDRPVLKPMQVNGKPKPLMVHLVVNVEHWQFTEPMPRKIITPPHGKENRFVDVVRDEDHGLAQLLPDIEQELLHG